MLVMQGFLVAVLLEMTLKRIYWSGLILGERIQHSYTYYSAGKCIVLSSKYEGFGIVIIEAGRQIRDGLKKYLTERGIGTK